MKKLPNGSNSKLARLIMFHQAVRLGDDICFRCGERIKTIDEFSIDHKESWLLSESPVEKFFDMGNISFSHRKCNIRAAFRYKKYSSREEMIAATRPKLRIYKRETYSKEKRRLKYLKNGT